MKQILSIVSKSSPALICVFGLMSVPSLAADLSRYRTFQLGTELSLVAGQAGATASQATVIHSRPALIQELKWRPQPLGSSAQAEPAKEAVLSFYNGELFRIVVKYDRFETEGLTTDDFTEAISSNYGVAVKPALPAKDLQRSYGDEDEVLARWEDDQYRFDLVRSSYGPSFKLVGVLKKLEAPAQAAILEGARLDELEAPQRDAARKTSADEAEKVRLEKARLVNKPKFRQ